MHLKLDHKSMNKFENRSKNLCNLKIYVDLEMTNKLSLREILKHN